MTDKQLPDGIEWPRFEDGALVQHRDRIMHMGRSKTVRAIYSGFNPYAPTLEAQLLTGCEYVLEDIEDGGDEE